jgi:hypothetical protein
MLQLAGAIQPNPSGLESKIPKGISVSPKVAQG